MSRCLSAALAVFLAFAIFAQTAEAADVERTITAYVPAHFPPDVALDAQGNPEGFAIDVMNAVAEKAGVSVRYVVKDTWDDVTRALQTGEADVSPSIGMTQERSSLAVFTPPIATLPVSVFVRSSGPWADAPIDLNGKTVGVVAGNVGQTILHAMPSVKTQVYTDPVNGLFGLLSGQIDAFVYPEPVTWSIAQQSGVDGRIQVSGDPLIEIKRAIAVNKQKPDLHAALSQAVMELTGSPQYQAIFAKWYGVPKPFWTADTLSVAIVVLALIALVVFAVASRLWSLNASLAQEIGHGKALEQSLTDHLRLYEAAINTPTMGFWAVDPQGHLIEVNQSYVAMSGYGRDELLAMSVSDLEALEKPEETAAHIAEIMAKGYKRFRSAHKRKDGSTFPVEITTSFMRDNGGVFLVFVEDIADKIQYEQSLETQLAERTKTLNAAIASRNRAQIELLKLSRAVEQSPHIIFITDTRGVIEYVNPKFTELLGYTAEEAVGQKPSLIKSGDTPEDVYAELWRTILDGREWHGEIKDRRRNGDIFWASTAISPVRDDTGEIINFIAIHEDITMRKETEIALRDARNAAEVANKAKSDLLANMSHELRTPLNAIIGFSEVTLHGVLGPIDNPQYKEYTSYIHSSGEHLLHLINDILDVSAIEAGKLTLREEAAAVNDMCDTALRFIASRAQEKNITIVTNCDAQLPVLYCDPLRVKQILINLLSNAVKFTPDDGEVTLAAIIDDQGRLVISVTDTGIGMDADGIAKALEKFGQVDSSLARKHEGSGLGLPLTLGLVELHGGTTELTSEPGQGTTVTVTFPSERVIRG